MSAPFAVSGIAAAPMALQLGGIAATQPPPPPVGPSFANMLSAGLNNMGAKLDAADTLVQRFAVDDSVPVHQVTIALEEARMSVELAMQVRGRLVEGYRELMNMQL